MRGILAALFSAMAFLMRSSAESMTLREFAARGVVVFLGVLAVAAGACTVAAGIWSSGKGKWWLLFVDGFAVTAIGVTLIFSNLIAFRAVTYLLILLAMVLGVVELVTAQALRRHVPDEWFLGLAGAASAGFALAFLWARPEEAGRSLIWLGSYSCISAICMLGLAARLRALRRSIHKIATTAAHSG